MKAIIILNPTARGGKAASRSLDRATRRLKSIDGVTEVECLETQHPHHARDLAQEAARQGTAYIVAAGGDGTISEVVNGIMRADLDQSQRPVLGALPWGTLNDFYVALKSAERSRRRKAADDEEPQFTLPLDIGRVTFDSLDCYSCLSVSVGLSSWANQQYQEASARFSRRFAHIPGAINALLTYRFSPAIRIARDGLPLQGKQMLAMAISNCAGVGGGVHLTPTAKIDDGLFDVCIIKPMPIWKVALVLLTARWGGHMRLGGIELERVRDISVSPEQPLPVHLDGEMIPEINSRASQIDVHVLPAELKIIAPSFWRRDNA